MKKAWSDESFSSLLSDWKEELPADESLRRRIEEEAGRARSSAAQLIPFRQSRAFRALAAFAAAAAALALAFIGARAGFSSSARFGSPLSLSFLPASQAGSELPGASLCDRGLRAQPGPEETALIEGGGLSIALAPGSDFSLEPASALDALLGSPPLRCTLNEGRISFRHGEGAPNFVLYTPYGSLRPLGTAFDLSVDKEAFELSVTEGSVSFKERGGRRSALSAGQSLRLGGDEPRSLSPAEAAALAVHLPGRGERAEPERSGPAEDGGAAASILAGQSPSDGSRPSGFHALWEMPVAPGVEEVLAVPEGSPLIVLRRGRELQALDGLKGALRWSVELPFEPASLGAGSGVLAQGEGRLALLSWKDGSLLWSLESPPLSLNRPVFGDDAIYLASADGSLRILDPEDGRERARHPLDSGSYGEPLPSGGIVMLSLLPDRFVALDAASGEELWGFRADARFAGDRPILSPSGSLAWNRDAAGTWYGIGTADGSERFRLSSPPELRFGPIPVTGLVWAQDDAGLYSLDEAGVRRDWPGIRGRILALGEGSSGTLLAVSAEGLWSLDPRRGAVQPSSSGSFVVALVDRGLAFTVDSSGTAAAWKELR